MTVKHACIEKRRGYIYLPTISNYNIVSTGGKSIMGLEVRKKNTFYVCKEGCIFVAGNHWMYEVCSGLGEPVSKYGLLNLTYTKDRVWFSYYDYQPLLFSKTSRVKLLFS
jgi:hypothetical protein